MKADTVHSRAVAEGQAIAGVVLILGHFALLALDLEPRLWVWGGVLLFCALVRLWWTKNWRLEVRVTRASMTTGEGTTDG